MSAAGYVRTVHSASLIFGSTEPPQDDAAETYHEASKLYCSTAARQTRSRLLESHLGLQVSSLRSVKRSSHLPSVALAEPALSTASFADTIESRRSERAFGEDPISAVELSSLLHAAYGVTHELDLGMPGAGPRLRTVPSGGALFPLEVYVVPWRVESLPIALYHFDPLRRLLERLRGGELEGDVRGAMFYDELAVGCGALFLISGVFWRTRFKYGLRGYRFALLECGHLAQNILLAATAFGLGSVPIGGFYDRRADELLGLDGVNESILYAVAVGRLRDAE